MCCTPLDLNSDAELWWSLYRIDCPSPTATIDAKPVRVYSTPNDGFLRYTCGGLVEGETYKFGLAVSSADEHSAISELVEVTTGLICTFAGLHGPTAGRKGKVRVQEKPFSRVPWVELTVSPANPSSTVFAYLDPL